MAQYDGAIRINTKIDNKEASSQLMTLENRIVKTADKIASLRSKMDSLKDAKIPTEEYKEISVQIEKATQKIDELKARQEKFLETGGKESSSTYKRIQYDIDELSNSLPYLEGELQDLVDTGKAFTLGSDTEEFSKLGQQLQYAENDLDSLNQRHNELLSKQEKNSVGYKKLKDSATSALKKIAKIVKSAAILSLKKLSGIITGTTIKAFRKLGSIAKNTFSKIGKSTKKTGGLFSTMVTRFKGLALSLLIFNQISKAFNAMISGIKEGMNNLAQYSDDTNRALSLLMSRMTYLKNALATAFSPIVEIVSPILSRFIELLGEAATKVSELFAALMGKDTFTKAIKVQQDYADSLKNTGDNIKDAAKEAKKALAPFDDLRQINFGEEDAKDKDQNTLTPEQMFETENVSNGMKSLAEKIQDAIKSADFSSIGQVIGQKLKDALDKIPWGEIKESARRIGQTIATFINGFIEVVNLGKSIGNTLAQAINTGFEFLNSFVHSLHWDSLGKFIAETMNGLFSGIDWPLIYDTFVTGAKGVADSINSFIENFEWNNISKTISNFVNTFVDTWYTFITNAKWGELGKNIGEQITLTFSGIDFSKAGKTIGEGIKSVLSFALNIIQQVRWGMIGEKIANLLNSLDWFAVSSTLFGALSSAVNGGINLVYQFIAGTEWSEIGKAIGINLQKAWDSIDWAMAGQTIGTGIKSILDFLLSLVKEMNWAQIGYDIGVLLQNVPWMDIFKEIFDIIWTVLSGLISGLLDTKAGKVIISIAAGIAAVLGLFKATDFALSVAQWAMGGTSKFSILLEGAAKLSKGLGTIMSGIGGLFSPTGLLIAAIGAGVALIILNWDKIKDAAKNLADWVAEKFGYIAKATADKWKEIKDKVSETWDNIKTSTSNSVENLKSTIQGKWDGIKSSTLSKWNEIETGISGAWNKIWGTASSSLSNIKETISSSWNELSNTTSSTWNQMQNNLSNVWNYMRSMAPGTFDSIKNIGLMAWESLKSGTSRAWNGMVNIVKSTARTISDLINGIIKGVQKAIEAINKLLGKQKDASKNSQNSGGRSGEGYYSSGYSSRTRSYLPPAFESLPYNPPALATGTVVPPNREFMAVLGDNKREPEVVSPLSTMKQAFVEALQESGALNKGQSGGPVYLQLDGKTLARLINPYMEAEKTRVGVRMVTGNV